MATLNETHDPGLRSWLASANAPGCDFPIQNLPFAVFRRQGSHEAFRGGVAIGDQVVDLGAAARAGAFSGTAATLRGWCEKPGAARIGFGACLGTVLPAS